MDPRVRIISVETLSHNWGLLQKCVLELQRRDGSWQEQVREVYDRGNAAVVLLADPERGTVILTRQFRYPVLRNGDPAWIIEACAGLLDGDDPQTCAIKEAQEETGYTPTELRHIFDVYMSPGSVTEKLSFFLGYYHAEAKHHHGGGLAHEGEDIEVIETGFADAMAMIESGEIVDAKTIMLLQWTALNNIFGDRTEN